MASSSSSSPASAADAAPRRPPPASTESVLVSKHSGLSGSAYDMRRPKVLGRAGFSLAMTAAQIVEARREPSTIPAPTQQLSETLATRARERERLKVALEDRRARGIREPPLLPSASLDDDHRDTIRTLFTIVDEDGDGELSGDDLRLLIAALGVPPTTGLLRRLQARSPRGSTGVGVEAIIAVLEERNAADPIREVRLDALFRHFDCGSAEGGHWPVVTSESFRHLLCGIPTRYRTELSTEDADEICTHLSLKPNEHLEPVSVTRALSSGFLRFEP